MVQGVAEALQLQLGSVDAAAATEDKHEAQAALQDSTHYRAMLSVLKLLSSLRYRSGQPSQLGMLHTGTLDQVFEVLHRCTQHRGLVEAALKVLLKFSKDSSKSLPAAAGGGVVASTGAVSGASLCTNRGEVRGVRQRCPRLQVQSRVLADPIASSGKPRRVCWLADL